MRINLVRKRTTTKKVPGRGADRVAGIRATTKMAFAFLSGVFLMAQASDQLVNPPSETQKSPPTGTQDRKAPDAKEFQRNFNQPPISQQGTILKDLPLNNIPTQPNGGMFDFRIK